LTACPTFCSGDGSRVLANTSSGPPLSRPLCPYPDVARYKGGDPADAASFECTA